MQKPAPNPFDLDDLAGPIPRIVKAVLIIAALYALAQLALVIGAGVYWLWHL